LEDKINSYLEFMAKQPQGTIYRDVDEVDIPINKQEELDKIKEKFKNCTLCPLARQGRTQVVFGHGNVNADLMFVGEGPGRDEDFQGLPFVGRAGQLLTKIIEAMGLSRKEVYISNVVKCRPPQNRTPLPEESLVCKNSILFREIEIIQPKIICTLGAVATQELLERPVSITKERGTFFKIKNMYVLPTFHPAFLLRNPEKKRDVWEDMKKITSQLEKTQKHK
jgi:uracil-DNA glycosylase